MNGASLPVNPARKTVSPTATRQATPSPTATITPTLPASLDAVWITNPTDQTVLRVDTQTNAISATIKVDARPDMVAAGEGAVWVLDRLHDRVLRINAETSTVAASIPLPPGEAETLVVGHGAVWVGMTGRVDLTAQVPGPEEDMQQPGVVVQIDPRENKPVNQFPAQPVSRMLIHGSMLWVLSHGVIDTPLQVFDLSSRQGMAVPLQNAPEWLPVDALAVDNDNVWLFSAAQSKIFHATPGGMIQSAVNLSERQPVGYTDMLATSSGLWAITPWGTILHIDPASNHILGQIELNAPLTSLSASAGAVWVLSQQTAMLFRIDPALNEITAEIATGSLVEPTVVPSPTPRIVLWKPCADAATSRLKVGDLAYVTKDPPLPNRIRKEPDTSADILGYIVPGGSMEILEGPTCANGWVWWKVKNADYTGWTPEGDKETYWLVPLFQ